jgi:hypothetical protein
LAGIPDMPRDYWEYMKLISPPLKMGKFDKHTGRFYPKTWRVLFNGAPGSGKSVSMAWMAAAQYLLRGIPVFTIPESYYIRVPILWKGKVYMFSTQPLEIEKLIVFDPMLQGTCVVADEANINLADSMRAAANKNLFIADYVQQARHHGVSMLYTTILSNWMDPRLQALTDIKIYCVDGENQDEGIEEGEWCFWNLTDESGALTKIPYSIEPHVYNWMINLKQYWAITDSFNIADSLSARKNISLADNRMIIGENDRADYVRMLGENLDSVVKQYVAANMQMPRVEIRAGELWKTLGIDGDQDAVTQAGKILTGTYGVIKRRKDDGYYYDLTPLRNV